MAATDTPTRVDDQLDSARREDVVRLLLQGRRVHEVIAHGLTRRPGWRRQHVIALIAEHGWTLDSDGRVPKRFRTQDIPPASALPGAPAPGPPRSPVVEYPPEGTVVEGRGANSAAALIGRGKAHDVPAIRRLAEKAEQALAGLTEAIRADEQNAVLRNRLAAVEAEAERLRAQLRLPGRPKKAATGKGRGGNRPVRPETLDKPIAHGTWGGWLAENKRGLDHCAPCETAKHWQTKWMQARSPEERAALAAIKPQPATQAPAGAQDADHG